MSKQYTISTTLTMDTNSAIKQMDALNKKIYDMGKKSPTFNWFVGKDANAGLTSMINGALSFHKMLSSSFGSLGMTLNTLGRGIAGIGIGLYNGFRKSLDIVSSITHSVLKWGGIAIGAGLGAYYGASKALEPAKQDEVREKRLEINGMTGMLPKFKEMSLKTSLGSVDELISSAVTLKNQGMDKSETMKMLQLMSDVKAGTGREMQETAHLFAIIKSGNLTGVFRQLTDLGISRNEMAKQGIKIERNPMGEAEIGQNEESRGKVYDAIVKILSTRYAGATAKMEGTTKDAQDDMWASAKNFMSALGKPFLPEWRSAMLYLGKAFQKLTDWASKHDWSGITSKLEAFGQKFKIAIDNLGKKGGFDNLLNGLSQIWNGVLAGFGALPSDLGKIFGWFCDNIKSIGMIFLKGFVGIATAIGRGIRKGMTSFSDSDEVKQKKDEIADIKAKLEHNQIETGETRPVTIDFEKGIVQQIPVTREMSPAERKMRENELAIAEKQLAIAQEKQDKGNFEMFGEKFSALPELDSVKLIKEGFSKGTEIITTPIKEEAKKPEKPVEKGMIQGMTIGEWKAKQGIGEHTLTQKEYAEQYAYEKGIEEENIAGMMKTAEFKTAFKKYGRNAFNKRQASLGLSEIPETQIASTEPDIMSYLPENTVSEFKGVESLKRKDVADTDKEVGNKIDSSVKVLQDILKAITKQTDAVKGINFLNTEIASL